MLHDLCGMLLRFRMHRITIVADIEKAFLQIGLQPNERDVTRFLWLKDYESPVLDGNIQEFRFCRVPFGIISNSFLLGATVENHLDSHNTEISTKVKNDIYVDSLITGTDSVWEAIQLYRETKSIFKQASMNIREWVSSSDEVNNFIPKEDRADCASIKVLGHTWNIEADMVSIKPPDAIVSPQEATKRSILKTIASVYDPLGLLSPVILWGNVMLQSLWKKNLDWDDKIEDEDLQVWHSIKSEIERISECEVPRCIAMENSNNSSAFAEYRLLCFCDASTNAYSTAVYMHQTRGSHSRADLIFSKTRLAQVKRMTIQRLKLMAVLIGVRCLQFVNDQLNREIEQTYLWTDSQCVLKWITTTKELSVFTRNRVNEINSHDNIHLRYVNTKENPADVATRGTTVNKLRHNSLWWNGPSWLLQPVWDWRQLDYLNGDSEEADPQYELELKKVKERKETILLFSEGQKAEKKTNFFNTETPLGIECEKYSSLSKLLRVTAYALRLVRKLKEESTESGHLTNSELDSAQNMWLLQIQRKHYPEVFKGIADKKPSNLQRQLGIYCDKNGIVRCRGRMEHACLSEGARCPILIPKGERFTHLLIEKIHKQTLHSGVSHTLSQIRYKFWIPQGRAIVRSVLKTCLVCRRHEGGPYKMPAMSPIPKSRLTESVPFSRTGLDYFGPLSVKTTEGAKKVWVCLFTCLVTRAVHLELIDDMSAEQFLLGFRRFIAHRGTPIEIISDNATQFKVASQTIHMAWNKLLNSSDVQSYVSNSEINWTFIVEMAPWMGVFYERLVGVVKRSLRKSLGRKLLTFIQLQTILKEIEAVVNSRPLVYVGEDLDSNITLTPGHFLTINPKIGIPEIDYEESDMEYNPHESSAERLLKTWKKGQKLLDAFWKIWLGEYLLNLRERTQTELKAVRIRSPYAPKVDDVVLLKDGVRRGCWKFGRVTSLTQSQDGNVRSAKVKMPSGRILGRPLNLLYPIEVQGHYNEDMLINKDKSSLETRPSIDRPKRIAAENARQKVREMV